MGQLTNWTIALGRPATDKKDRLVEAAMTRFHRHGGARTSLAAVAGDAKVAPGNVYYYFRSKDALAAAVIDRWCERVEAHLAGHEASPDPRDRIRGFLTHSADRRRRYADFGCPLAALRNDFRLASPSLASGSSRPLLLIRDWLAGQFRESGATSDAASRHADFCLATLQGSYALAHVTGDPAVIERTVDELRDWLDHR